MPPGPAAQPAPAAPHRAKGPRRAWACGALGLLLLAAGCEDPVAPPMGQPVEGAWISDGFGPRPVHPVLGVRGAKHHDGVDFAIRQGAPFKATMAGEVFEAGNKPGYGLAVFIRHQDGYETRYAHASQLLVKSGQRVAAGQVLGLVGRSGTATGPHLHYELRQNGKAMDPMPFLARSQDGPSPLPSPSPQPSRFVWPSPQAYAMPPRGRLGPSARPRSGRPTSRPATRRIVLRGSPRPPQAATGRPGPMATARPGRPRPRVGASLPPEAVSALQRSRAAAAAARLRPKASAKPTVGRPVGRPMAKPSAPGPSPTPRANRGAVVPASAQARPSRPPSPRP